ncbi:MAG: TlpA family protein disulfide reductase [Bacteroidia bacterium]
MPKTCFDVNPYLGGQFHFVKYLLTYLFLLPLLFASAQPRLKPLIGGAQKPLDSDSIASSPAPGPEASKSEIGLKTGDTIPQFVLYNAQGKALDAQKELAKGKPLFLMAGSYTCHNYRDSLDNLSRLMKKYGDKISFFIIYTIEAHPGFPDVCPYTNEYAPNKENYMCGVDCRQPKTYKERKALAAKMAKSIKIPAPVFFDTPDNQWWLKFGPLPNITYLITPQGLVYSKMVSFHNSYRAIADEIESLLKQKL